jgi:hypothetical protein
MVHTGHTPPRLSTPGGRTLTASTLWRSLPDSSKCRELQPHSDRRTCSVAEGEEAEPKRSAGAESVSPYWHRARSEGRTSCVSSEIGQTL